MKRESELFEEDVAGGILKGGGEIGDLLWCETSFELVRGEVEADADGFLD